MREKVLQIFIVLFLFGSCDFLRQFFVSPAPMTSERWRQDLRYLARHLPRLHKNLFFQISETEFKKAVADLDKSIPSLEDHEVIVGFMRILAMIGDSHTDLYDSTYWYFGFRIYPLGLLWFGNQLVVVSTTLEHRSLLGMQVVKIGDTDMEKAYSLISAIIPHENEVQVRVRSPRFLVTAEILHALHIIPDMEKAKFILKDTQGKTISVELSPIEPYEYYYRDIKWTTAYDAPGVSKPLALQNEQDYYWFTYLEDYKTLYFKYNHCWEMKKKPFRQFMKELLHVADTLPVEKVIIDFRHNVGGSTEILKPLIKELKKRPTINRKGHLFALIGPMTFSSAVLNAITLQEETQVILVGEPTGGKPNSYGDIKKIRLPNSRLIITYSTQYFHPLEGDPPSLMPDILVETTVEDYFSGKDPKLEKILSYSQK